MVLKKHKPYKKSNIGLSGLLVCSFFLMSCFTNRVSNVKLSDTSFYINSTTGDDSNDGLSPTVTTKGHGPWRTFNNVNQPEPVIGRKFNTGDKILLADGALFFGPLVFGEKNIEAHANIFVGAFPGNKNNLPVITGAKLITDITTHKWQPATEKNLDGKPAGYKIIIPSWSAVHVKSGNRYNYSSPSSTEKPLLYEMLYLFNESNENIPIGRYPNTGYVAVNDDGADNPKTQTEKFICKAITGSNAKRTDEWNNTRVAMHTIRWMVENHTITATTNQKSELQFTPNNFSDKVHHTTLYNYEGDWGCIFYNNPMLLDKEKEWCYQYNAATDEMCLWYYSNTLPPATLKISLVDDVIGIHALHYEKEMVNGIATNLTKKYAITINGLKIENATYNGIYAGPIALNANSPCSAITISNCNFENEFKGIQLYCNDDYEGHLPGSSIFSSPAEKAVSVTISKNTFSNLFSNGIRSFYANELSIDDNKLENIGLDPCLHEPNNLGHTAIAFVKFHKAVVANNVINNVGGAGIGFALFYDDLKSEFTVEKNSVSNCTLATSDMGGIYFSSGATDHDLPDTAHPPTRIIRNNTVTICKGNVAGCAKDYQEIITPGIYLDYKSRYVIAENNTVSNCTHGGVFLHKTENCKDINNTVINCDEQ